jgi:hypothetical protein
MMHDVHKSYTIDIQATPINFSTCNNPDRDKLNTHKPNFNLYHTVGTYIPHITPRGTSVTVHIQLLPIKTFLTMPSYQFHFYNKRRQRLYAHYHFQLQISNQPNQTESSQQSKPMSIPLKQTYDSQHDARQGVTCLVNQNRALQLMNKITKGSLGGRKHREARGQLYH